MTLEKGLAVLHLDAGVNDDFVTGLLDAIPAYIETATGLPADLQPLEPLCDVAAAFLLRLWYFGDHADDLALKRTVESLLKTIKAKTAANAAARSAALGTAGNIPIFDTDGRLVDSGVRFATGDEISELVDETLT